MKLQAPPSTMTKAEAYNELRKVEDSASEASRALSMIAKEVEAGRTTWEEGVDSFKFILKHEGGNKFSEAAQKGFSAAVNGLKQGRGRSLIDMAGVYAFMRENENYAGQARGNFKRVLQAADTSEEGITMVAAHFNQVLKAEGGDMHTKEAQEAFDFLLEQGERLKMPIEVMARWYVGVRNRTPDHLTALLHFAGAADAALKHGKCMSFMLKELATTIESEEAAAPGLDQWGEGPVERAGYAFNAMYDVDPAADMLRKRHAED